MSPLQVETTKLPPASRPSNCNTSILASNDMSRTKTSKLLGWEAQLAWKFLIYAHFCVVWA